MSAALSCVSTAVRAWRMARSPGVCAQLLLPVGSRRTGTTFTAPLPVVVTPPTSFTTRYGEGHLSKIVQGVDWMLGRLRQRAGGVSYNAEAVVYVASDDPTSAAQLTARPHRASIKYHQLDLPVFHVDRRARGGHAVKDMFLDVIAEHQLLAMCDGWVMPGSG